MTVAVAFTASLFRTRGVLVESLAPEFETAAQAVYAAREASVNYPANGLVAAIYVKRTINGAVASHRQVVSYAL